MRFGVALAWSAVRIRQMHLDDGRVSKTPWAPSNHARNPKRILSTFPLKLYSDCKIWTWISSPCLQEDLLSVSTKERKQGPMIFHHIVGPHLRPFSPLPYHLLPEAASDIESDF